MGVADSFASFSFAYFKDLGNRVVLRLAPGIPEKLDATGKRIHPEVFASMVMAAFFISLGVTGAVMAAVYLITLNPLYVVLLAPVPLLVLLFGIAYPYLSAVNAASMYESEVPYAAAYLAVMSTGGIPPYKSLERLSDSDLLPSIARSARIAQIHVKVAGEDPVTAIEKMAKGLPSKEYRDLLLGYASTLRSGGDVVHYLIRKTEQIFTGRMGTMRIVGERMGMLMEGFAAITMMLSLVLFTIYIISRALPSEFMVMPQEQFVIIAYVILPTLSIVFVYIADISQPKYPQTDPRPMRVFYLTMPAGLVFLFLFVFPFFVSELRTIPALNFTSSLMVAFRSVLGLEPGYESSLALCLTFIVLFLPGAVAFRVYSSENFSVIHGMTLFLRDLTEVRKTGLSPEQCIIDLSRNSYGAFSKRLNEIARQISWGIPLKKIYQDFAKRTYGWLEKAGMFILIDAIDVGGGAPETLEVLARFSEDLEEIERQKRATLRPLMMIPYLTAILLVVVVVILIVFMRELLKVARMPISIAEFVGSFLPPVIFIAAISGLVAGKISTSRIAGGFVHATVLSVVSLLAIWISGVLAVQIFQLPAVG
ncbi:MAG: type II secretion system F family protein [Nitrososphaerota archaeon]|nr:type II secretion system F family protein [Nitrososphaerota archaeon]